MVETQGLKELAADGGCCDCRRGADTDVRIAKRRAVDDRNMMFCLLQLVQASLLYHTKRLGRVIAGVCTDGGRRLRDDEVTRHSQQKTE